MDPRSLLLVAALVLGSSALTPEECQKLLTPLSLEDPSVMYGRWNFLSGFIDNPVFSSIVEKVESSWFNISPSSNANEVKMSQEEKLNGTCVHANVTLTIKDNTLTTSIANVSSVLQLLSAGAGGLVMSVNSTAKHFDKLLEKMNYQSDISGDEISFHQLFLMGTGTTAKDSDLEQFKQQAACLGFSGEPDFSYDPKNGFCAEGEGIKI